MNPPAIAYNRIGGRLLVTDKCLPALFLFFQPKLMINTVFAKKAKMSGMYTTDGSRVGVTVLNVPLLKVAQLRTKEKNGYEAVQIEIGDKKKSYREVRTTELGDLAQGTEIKFDEVLKVGDKVNVTGVMKGKGFAGAVKRHGFAGGPRTHGQSDRERAPGSSGSTTTPGRVYKGKRRAGHMGAETVTIKNLEVLNIDTEGRKITLKGSVPGTNNYTLLTLKKI